MTEHADMLQRVRRTSTTLADGRELIYFDDSEPYPVSYTHLTLPTNREV